MTTEVNQIPNPGTDSKLPLISPKKFPETLWFFVGFAIFIVFAIGLVIYWTMPFFSKQSSTQNQQSAQNISQILDEAARLPQINIPSSNPLEKIAPEKNPIELTNPFDNAYQNPFE